MIYKKFKYYQSKKNDIIKKESDKMERFQEYYRLGIRNTDKLINAVFCDDPIKGLTNYKIHEEKRKKNNLFVIKKEMSYFWFGILTVLVALNKELIEENGINLKYEYDINEIIKEKNNIDTNYSKINTNYTNKYDSWLNVINCDMLQPDFMFNVRNGLLHSEFEPSNEDLITYNVRNSNYTNFEAQINLLNFFDFCIFYFGNSSSKDFIILRPNVYSMIFDKEIEIKSQEDLQEFLNSLKVDRIKREENNKKKINETIEAHVLNKMQNDELLQEYIEFEEFYENKPKLISLDEQKIIKQVISKIGNIFYTLDFSSQMNYICSIYNSIKNPNFAISNWVTYYLEVVLGNNEVVEETYANMSFGTGIDKIAALYIKLNYIIYRLQYKLFEEIDYSLVDIDLSTIKYDENGAINGISPFVHAYNKFQTKDNSKSDRELKIKVLLDIIRNAVVHGKVDIKFEVDPLEINLVFMDKYKGKERSITLNIDELKKIVQSEAFDGIKAVEKNIDKGKTL